MYMYFIHVSDFHDVLNMYVYTCNADSGMTAAEVEVEETGGWGDDVDIIIDDGEFYVTVSFLSTSNVLCGVHNIYMYSPVHVNYLQMTLELVELGRVGRMWGRGREREKEEVGMWMMSWTSRKTLGTWDQPCLERKATLSHPPKALHPPRLVLLHI